MDITKCEFYEKALIGCNNVGMCNRSDDELKLHKWEVCKDNPNCYYKQLHSQGCNSKLSEAHQEKTFTVEEIREIIFKNFNCSFNFCEPFVKNSKMCTVKNCIKNNEDCRECLLAEFEKAVG